MGYENVSRSMMMPINVAGGSDQPNEVSAWHHHLDYIGKSTSFSDNEKTRILGGLSRLRDFFPDEWLKEMIENSPTRHPLVSHISNYAPWSQFWLTDFAHRLDCISLIPRFDELIERLKDPEQYCGAEPESDSMYRLKNSGFDVELYPRIGVGKRKADLRATIRDCSYFFEISSLQSSKKANAATHTFNSLTFPYSFMFHDEIIVQCKIHKSLAEPRIQEMKNRIEQAISQVRKDRRFAFLGEPGVMDYLIIHNEMAGELDALVNRFGMQRGINGPAFDVDDTRRIEAKFWDEVRQLPEDKPSAIVVYANLTLFPGNSADFYKGLAYQIEEAIYAHRNLIMGVIIGQEAGDRDPGITIEEPSYFFAKTDLNSLMSESTLIVKNRYSQFAELATNEDVFAAFIGGSKSRTWL